MWHDCVYVAKQRWKSIFFFRQVIGPVRNKTITQQQDVGRDSSSSSSFDSQRPWGIGTARGYFSLLWETHESSFFFPVEDVSGRDTKNERERARARWHIVRNSSCRRWWRRLIIFFGRKKVTFDPVPKNRSGSSPLLQTTNFDSNKLSFAAQNRPVFNGAGDSLFCLVDRRSRLTSFAREGAVSPAASTTRMRWPWRGGGWTDTSFFFWEKKKCMAFFTSTDPLDDAPLLPADSPFVCSKRKTACRQRPLTG